jgi:hypothetical protein
VSGDQSHVGFWFLLMIHGVLGVIAVQIQPRFSPRFRGSMFGDPRLSALICG